MSKSVILLTLTGLAQFTRADLKDGGGVPVVVQRNQTIAVPERIAIAITGEEYGVYDADDNFLPWFRPAAAGVYPDHDFTEPGGFVERRASDQTQGTVTHDLESLPKEVPLAEAVASGALAKNPAAPRRTSQRK